VARLRCDVVEFVCRPPHQTKPKMYSTSKFELHHRESKPLPSVASTNCAKTLFPSLILPLHSLKASQVVCSFTTVKLFPDSTPVICSRTKVDTWFLNLLRIKVFFCEHTLHHNLENLREISAESLNMKMCFQNREGCSIKNRSRGLETCISIYTLKISFFCWERHKTEKFGLCSEVKHFLT